MGERRTIAGSTRRDWATTRREALAMPGTTRTRRRPVHRAPVPLRVSDPGADPQIIRQRAGREGYVFCRALVPRPLIDALRGFALAVAKELGWLDANAPPGAALVNADVRLGAYDDPRWIAFLQAVLPHASFAALRVAPAVVAMLTAILGAPPEPDAGDLCRVVSSDDPDHTTVAHQDRFYLPGGATRWSMWVPLGSCPVALGPLAVLPRSHARGLLPHAGDVPWRRGVDVPDDAGWAASDLEPGDAIFFSWLTVHRALPNVSGRALRLSATYRYRAAGGG
jgi:Phytanoyl-CoA dioxygenase (PhyH)